jgi:hypothetical protein
MHNKMNVSRKVKILSNLRQREYRYKYLTQKERGREHEPSSLLLLILNKLPNIEPLHKLAKINIKELTRSNLSFNQIRVVIVCS